MADNLYKKCVEKWGLPKQLNQLTEECGELIVAVNHIRRGRITLDEFIEELADVQIMIEQLKYQYGDEVFNHMMNKKKERLEMRLND